MKRLVKVRHRQPVGPAATRVGAVIAAVAITGGGMAACSKDDAKDAMSTASSHGIERGLIGCQRGLERPFLCHQRDVVGGDRTGTAVRRAGR